ncbi:MAG: tRNA (cytidine(34)-2'-O)-methyltransferase [Bacilli bacterium]|jgi:tRNA (cytidine/uridine-2'-O-)-methyltransferase|nr:tRNA (cytidine(34)-2'-O)-methyltransferase [Bacilli bacterium]
MIHIVLFRPEKPLNTGNIMRTCVAIGAKLHVIGPIDFSLAEKDIKRAGLDYIERLKLEFHREYFEFENKYGKEDIFYVTRYANKTYTSFDFSDSCKDIFLMFGRESTGIPHEILRENKNCLLRIPMISDTRSLNLANSVAIVVYEVLRQQKFEGLATQEEIKGSNWLEKEIING